MIVNYFKIAYRNLLKRKSYFFLNAFGIIIGMLCCLFIFHYVSYEKSYDSHIKNSVNKYRLRLDHYYQGENEWKSATVYPAIGPTIKRDFPEVEKFCRLIDATVLLHNIENDSKFSETKGYFADQASIDILSLEITQGNKDKALTGPNKIILSESMAKKYFGNSPAIGKTLLLKQRRKDYLLEITGLFKDYPANSHLDIRYLTSLDSYKDILRKQGYPDTTDFLETLFDWYDYYTYIELKPGTNPKQVETKLPAFCKKYHTSDYASNTYDELHLIPIRDIHLKSNYNQEAETNGNAQTVAFLLLIGVIIVFIAWINYINLSTARSVERGKEVGIKKVLGAFQGDLIKQFLTENILLNLISLVIAILLFFVGLQLFDRFCGRDFPTNMSLDSKHWIIFGFIIVVGTLLSGIYPAFILSGYNPIRVLKGSFKNSDRGIALRKSLIIIQFTISVILISGTFIVFQQVNFMRNKNLGASLQQTLVLKGAVSISDSIYKSTLQPFYSELLKNPSIKKIAASSVVPGQEIYWVDGARKIGKNLKQDIAIYGMAIDENYIPLYDIKIKAGRNFSNDFPVAKKSQVLINEKAAQLLGFKSPDEAVNQFIVTSSQDTALVVGVIANYHHQGLQKEITPMLIPWDKKVRQHISIKFNTDDLSKSITSIESTWKKFYPNDPFNYFFLDSSFDEQYKTDKLFGKVFTLFAVLAILIACMGMLGLSAYNVLQRSKEIGIRKVLGASVSSILVLLTKDFIILIGIAFLIAIPMAWYVMNMWLQDFAYRITIRWWIFVLAGVCALLFSLGTILMHAYKNIKTNPTKNLRTE